MDKNNKQFGLILPKSKQGASSNSKKPVANIFKQDSSSEDDETKGQLILYCPYEMIVSSKINSNEIISMISALKFLYLPRGILEAFWGFL